MTFRRRKTKVHSKYGYDEGQGYETRLEVYLDQIRITQDRGEFCSHELVILDRTAMDYLNELWQEVKDSK